MDKSIEKADFRVHAVSAGLLLFLAGAIATLFTKDFIIWIPGVMVMLIGLIMAMVAQAYQDGKTRNPNPTHAE